MDFVILHHHQEFRHPYSYRSKYMAHYKFWVISDTMHLNDKNKENLKFF